jgi:Tfp pilus assembly protein PilV
MMQRFRSRNGQSLIEVLIGVGLGAAFVIAAAGIIAPSLQTNTDVTQVQIRAQLAEELMKNVQAWSAGNWDGVLSTATGTQHIFYLNTAISPFSIVTATSTTSTESIAETTSGGTIIYDRYFYLSDVYRDSNGNVTTTLSGNFYDPSTKLVTVVVTASSTEYSGNTTVSGYITRNTDNLLNQSSWAGGSGQNSPVTVVTTTYAAYNNTAINASGTIQLAVPPGGTCIL